mmetsp:Transcript_44549/g.132994  ORF Transcript_44549/g.132994 Transcript_44549/m.132994 type:complete len:235 (+) Transcript_44549:293-997(+)
MRTPQKLGLPARDVLEANALGEVLATQDCSRRGDGLRAVMRELRADNGELDQIVRKAETLLRPPRLPQVSSQECVCRRLVHPEVENPTNLDRCSAHILGRASAVGDKGQPGGKLRVLGSCCVVQPGRSQRAAHAGQLQLVPWNAPRGQVGVQVAKRAEEHVLRIGLAVQRDRGIAAGVHLRDPIEEDRSKLVAVGAPGRRGRRSVDVQFQEDLALCSRQQCTPAPVAQRVAPDV